MKKNVIIGIVFIAIFFLSYFVYSLYSFNIFDVEAKKISNVILIDKPYRLGIYYVPSNASNQSSIQIREDEKDSVLQFYERYNFLKSYKVTNDTLILCLSDTSIQPIQIDTIVFKLP